MSTDYTQSLNGAQVQGLLSIINNVSIGEITKETAKQLILTSFSVTPEQVDEILKEVEYNPSLIQEDK